MEQLARIPKLEALKAIAKKQGFDPKEVDRGAKLTTLGWNLGSPENPHASLHLVASIANSVDKGANGTTIKNKFADLHTLAGSEQLKAQIIENARQAIDLMKEIFTDEELGISTQ